MSTCCRSPVLTLVNCRLPYFLIDPHHWRAGLVRRRLCVCVCLFVYLGETECMCWLTRERERAHVCLLVCLHERESACVFVCLLSLSLERVHVFASFFTREREREHVCLLVCLLRRECMCVCVGAHVNRYHVLFVPSLRVVKRYICGPVFLHRVHQTTPFP